MRRICAALGPILVAVIALLTVHSMSQASSTRCEAGALRLISTGGQGAAGTEFSGLRFALRRDGRCTLRGYPGVSLLDGHHRFAIHVTRYPGSRPRTVALAAGHPAYFNFVYGAAAPPDGTPCHLRVTRLRVIPPGERRSLTVRVRPRALLTCRHGLNAVEAVRSTAPERLSRTAKSQRKARQRQPHDPRLTGADAVAGRRRRRGARRPPRLRPPAQLLRCRARSRCPGRHAPLTLRRRAWPRELG